MKVSLYIFMIALLFTATSCAKKKPTNTVASDDSSAFIPQDGSEFAHRKPFIFTVTTDIDVTVTTDIDVDEEDEYWDVDEEDEYWDDESINDDDEDWNDAPKDNRCYRRPEFG